MKRILTICLAIAALTVGATAQEKKAAAPQKKAAALANKLELKDLPPAVQKTIQDQSVDAEIETIGKETEHGVAQYEVEFAV